MSCQICSGPLEGEAGGSGVPKRLESPKLVKTLTESLRAPHRLSALDKLMAELLVVDDSRVMREMIIASLRTLEAAKFTQAASGLEAIEQLSLPPFDAVVLD